MGGMGLGEPQSVLKSCRTIVCHGKRRRAPRISDEPCGLPKSEESHAGADGSGEQPCYLPGAVYINPQRMRRATESEGICGKVQEAVAYLGG